MSTYTFKAIISKNSKHPPWVSEGIFPGGPLVDFYKNFSRWWAQRSRNIFFPLETKKTTFFAEIFKIQGWALDPLPTPMAPTLAVDRRQKVNIVSGRRNRVIHQLQAAC